MKVNKKLMTIALIALNCISTLNIAKADQICEGPVAAEMIETQIQEEQIIAILDNISDTDDTVIEDNNVIQNNEVIEDVKPIEKTPSKPIPSIPTKSVPSQPNNLEKKNVIHTDKKIPSKPIDKTEIIEVNNNQVNTYNYIPIAENRAKMLIDDAKQYLGCKYVYGGESFETGIDCSAYVQKLFARRGINTGRTSRDQYVRCKKITYSEIKPGDLVFYAHGINPMSIHHVAIYIGNNKIIHACNSKTGVIISDYNFKLPYAFGRFF